MFRRIIAFVLCITLCISILPVISVSSSADNSGFCQIRIFWKEKDSLGNWGSEKSAIITDNSCLRLSGLGSKPIQITRFLVRNDSSATCYFQFDINFGSYIPNSGTFPSVSYSSLAFSVNGGVTAYSFDTTDKSDFFLHYEVNNQLYYESINSSSSRTFFGKVNSSGYITFNSPVILTFNPGDSLSNIVCIFFRHLVIGIDDSSYLLNLEHYLADISDNTYAISNDVSEINDWMEEEKDLFDDSWDSGGSQTYQEYTSDNNSFWGTLRGLFGFSIFGGLWSLDIFSTSNSLFSSWFSQDNADNINGLSRRSAPEETEFIDYYQKNINGELDVFGLGGDDP